MEILRAKKTANGMFRVSYDDHVLGDSRAFATEELCEQEIRKIMTKDAREAIIYDRPLLYGIEEN